MDRVLETAQAVGLRRTLLYLAKRRFRFSRDVSQDLVQSSIVTYLEVRDRYPRSEEHLRILVGIFRNKCREQVGRSVRAAKGLGALRSVAETGSSDVASARREPTEA